MKSHGTDLNLQCVLCGVGKGTVKGIILRPGKQQDVNETNFHCCNIKLSVL